MALSNKVIFIQKISQALRARNFLRFFYREAYEDLPTFPDDRTTKKRSVNTPTKPQTAKKADNIKVYPNPANDLVNCNISYLM